MNVAASKQKCVNVENKMTNYVGLCLTGQQSKSFRGYSGGNVNISFRYEQKDKKNEKVCKYNNTNQCVTVINTNRRAEGKHDRRFSVHDDRSAGLSWLFIRDLTENDSGKYRFTVKVSENYSFFSEFDLHIGDGKLPFVIYAFVFNINALVKSISLSVLSVLGHLDPVLKQQHF